MSEVSCGLICYKHIRQNYMYMQNIQGDKLTRKTDSTILITIKQEQCADIFHAVCFYI